MLTQYAYGFFGFFEVITGVYARTLYLLPLLLRIFLNFRVFRSILLRPWIVRKNNRVHTVYVGGGSEKYFWYEKYLPLNIMVFCPFFLFPFYWLAGFSTFMVFFVHATIHLMPNFSVFASPINLETE